MQMYRGLPIITNKIPESERNSIPHHLLGTVSLASEPWSVPKFVHESQRIIQEIRSRGRLPILVGGSHYYTQALLLRDALVASPETGQHSEIEAEASDSKTWPILSAATAEIYANLQEVDPVIAKRWHPNDRRHIQRSLEIWLQTGRKASDVYGEQYQQRVSRRQNTSYVEDVAKGSSDELLAGNDLRYPTLIFWVETEDSILLPRLNSRVDVMVKEGMIEEAIYMDQFERDQVVEGCPVDTGRGIWISIGYKEMQPYVNAMKTANQDESSLRSLRELCIEDTKAATRQYARRQKRWIRIRLANSFNEAGASKRLYVFDSADLEQWNLNVTVPSHSIVEKFLKGESLPEPSSLSEVAATVLRTTSVDGNRHQTFLARTCEVCNKTTATDLDWQRHLASRKHSKALYGKAKRERGEARRQQIQSCAEERELVDDGGRDW